MVSLFTMAATCNLDIFGYSFLITNAGGRVFNDRNPEKGNLMNCDKWDIQNITERGKFCVKQDRHYFYNSELYVSGMG